MSLREAERGPTVGGVRPSAGRTSPSVKFSGLFRPPAVASPASWGPCSAPRAETDFFDKPQKSNQKRLPDELAPHRSVASMRSTLRACVKRGSARAASCRFERIAAIPGRNPSGREPRFTPVLGESEGDSRDDQSRLLLLNRRLSCRAGWVPQGQKYRDVLLRPASQDASRADPSAVRSPLGDPIIRIADNRATRPDPPFLVPFLAEQKRDSHQLRSSGEMLRERRRNQNRNAGND